VSCCDLRKALPALEFTDEEGFFFGSPAAPHLARKLLSTVNPCDLLF
jgi:hypothetical protein